MNWLDDLGYGVVGSDLGYPDLDGVALLRVGHEDHVSLNSCEPISPSADLGDRDIHLVTDLHGLRAEVVSWKSSGELSPFLSRSLGPFLFRHSLRPFRRLTHQDAYLRLARRDIAEIDLSNIIREESRILLYLSQRKTWLVQVETGRQFHTHAGIVNLQELVGKEYGSRITSSLGTTLWAFEPTAQDFIMKSERKTQILYPKDCGMIAVRTGLASGQKVVEAGTGSGALTLFLASLVRPGGHVYSYEIREEFIAIARRNLEKADLSQYVTIQHHDAKEGVDVKEADVAIVDVGDPWLLVPAMKEALKGSGRLAAVCPTMNQLEKLTTELIAEGFLDVESLEVIVREIQARPGMTRPATRMVGHTAFLAFARKAIVE